MAKGLNDKQRRFVAEYLIDSNATQAATRAGYSAKTARQIGERLLSHVDVAAAVKAGQAKIAAKLEIKAEDVLRALLRVANADIRKIVDADGNALKLHELPDDLALSLSGVDVEELWGSDGDGGRCPIGNLHKFRLNDRLKALELLGKNLALFTDKQQLTGADGAPLSIAINGIVRGGK